MKKQFLTLLLLLFSFFPANQAGNIYSFPSHTHRKSTVLKKDSILPTASVFYSPEELGMKISILARIDSIVNGGINSKAFPGCQVLILKNGKTVYNKCFGYYTYENLQQVKPTTLYDLASLSKTTGTLLAIMKLYDEGKLKLTDKASQYLPFLRGTDKENSTITDLLFHESGLPPGLSFENLVLEKNISPSNLASEKNYMHSIRMSNPKLRYNENLVSKIRSEEYSLQVSDSFYLHKSTHEKAMKMIADARLGKKTYLYSDLNFILLKEIVETISKTPMDIFLIREFYSPMKLNNIVYLPLRTHQPEDIAPTLQKDYLRNGLIQGYVHDPSAAFLGGVSGNAGLFATAQDVAQVYQMLLNNGELNGNRYLSTETCKLFTTTTSANGRRGLGFDKPAPATSKNKQFFISASPATYGHTGYTGTCCWVDPESRLVYVFLSNRTYPNDGINKLSRMRIRSKIQEVIYQSMK
jgi:CubicO group peptidase (beta-lactamase class C family)